MKKIILQICLIAAIVLLGYWLYDIFKTPIEFQNIRETREQAIVERLKDIRTAERAYRTRYGKFTGSFDTLVSFIKNDSVVVEMSTGSEDDSAAVAKGLVRKVKYFVAVKDTLFPNGFVAEDIRIIPYSVESLGKAQEFELGATLITTESKVVVPVFAAFAPYTSYLSDLDKQELINYRDMRVNTLKKDDGLKVGSLEGANNEAGNWEN